MLEQPEPRAALMAGLGGVDRLILLGDLLELRQGPLRDVLPAVRPVLSEIAAGLGPDKEIVIVPGNHDHGLLAEWRARRSAGSPLALDSPVDWRSGEPLAAVAEALGPARVRASYPGLWLRSDTYATHGHYLDRHITVPLLERLGAGVIERVRSPRNRDGRLGSADGYEAVLAPMYDLIGRVADRGLSTGLGLQTRVWRGLQRRGPDHRGRFLPLTVGLLNRVGLGPLNPDLSGDELRRAGLRAFDEVLRRLAVRADHVIFGHTHRAGPLPGDDRSEWVAATGAEMINAGSWVFSREFTGRRPRSSPYRSGFAAVVDEQGPPQMVNLLDGAREPAGEEPASALRPDPA